MAATMIPNDTSIFVSYLYDINSSDTLNVLWTKLQENLEL